MHRWIDGVDLGRAVSLHEPMGLTSKCVYDHISDHLESWVAKAVAAR